MGAGRPNRIATLDIVRGVAVMGILLMNIAGFALIDAAYFNPRAQGGAEGIDLAVYVVNFILFDGKMRGLFSFLFGASMLLVIERAEANGENPARVHYMRMIWLFVFGLIHLYLVWWGDILNHYALIGMIAFFFRQVKVPTLLIVGTVLVLLQTLLMLGMPYSIQAAEAMLANPAQAEQGRAILAGFAKGFGEPPAEFAAKQMAAMHGDYLMVLQARIGQHLWSPLTNLMFIGAETLAYMLFGMAAFRTGMLTGAWTRARYVKWAAIGFGIGIPCYAAIAAYVVGANFDLYAGTLGLMVLPTPVRPLMIAGWASLIILLARPGRALTDRIGAAGRMAFTNYLATSLICTTIFYGYGFGLYGSLSRAEIYLVVFAIWAAMLLWSKPWLSRFAYGPLEWLWRSLARGRMQSMKRPAIGATASQ